MTPAEILAAHGPREAMDYDVVVVGAGPAGLATAIRLKQINPELSVARLEKEKQFNRKVEINAALRTLKTELEQLSR